MSSHIRAIKMVHVPLFLRWAGEYNSERTGSQRLIRSAGTRSKNGKCCKQGQESSLSLFCDNSNELATNNGETRDYTEEQTHDNRRKTTRGTLPFNDAVNTCVGKKTNNSLKTTQESQYFRNSLWSRYKNILVATCIHLVPFVILVTNGLVTLFMFTPKRSKEVLLWHEEQDLLF